MAAARALGFELKRQRGSHTRWAHPEGRFVVIPVHGSRAIGGVLYYKTLKQLGISEAEFRRLK